MNDIISIYGHHDSSITFIDNSNKIRVLEYERLVKKRYAKFSDQFDNHPLGTDQNSRKVFLQYVLDNIFNKNIKTILYNELSETDLILLSSFFPNTNKIKVGHHTAHAASGYYTSPFNEALIISIDGGGNELNETVKTKTFIGKDNNLLPHKTFKIDFGNAYNAIGYPISEINVGKDDERNSLTYAGKIMGLCAYGAVRKDWVHTVVQHYLGTISDPDPYAYKHYAGSVDLGTALFGKSFSLNFLKNKDSYDLAATTQHVFEKIFFDVFWNIIVEENLDVILVGGCGLNVLLNQKLSEKLKEINKELFVPCCPNDSGLSLGQFLYHTQKKETENICYNGFEILDDNNLNALIQKYNAKVCSVTTIVDLIKQGKMIGIIQDGSEIGPRALGNRSIICDPCIKDMKDILNAKVKFREWYRPFAPVCRYEDKDIYFDNAFKSCFMSYAPTVKHKYREILPSITHKDNTARLQTVKKEDHELFYSILTELHKRSEVSVILNTSFNIKGLPILTTIKDALHVLNNTELDYVYCNGYLFE